MTERKYTRVQHCSQVELRYQNQRYQTTTEDLSLRGMKILLPGPLDVPLDSPITLDLQEGELRSLIEGRVAFQGPQYWGIVFTRIGDSSLKNLITILQSQAPQGAQIRKEVQKMVLRVCD